MGTARAQPGPHLLRLVQRRTPDLVQAPGSAQQQGGQQPGLPASHSSGPARGSLLFGAHGRPVATISAGRAAAEERLTQAQMCCLGWIRPLRGLP